MEYHENMQFLAGGGEMGELTRSYNWEQTKLGNPVRWPKSLLCTLSIVLNSRFPMFLWWGSELNCFYNDAYRPSLGQQGKHPSILGMPAVTAWPEIWPIIHPFIEQVLTTGEAVWSEDQLVPIFRNGTIEDVYWTFSYSAVKGDSGKIEGVLVTCTETTEKIKTFLQLEENRQQLEFAIDAAELGTFDYNPMTNKFEANARLRAWFGLSNEQVIALPNAIRSIADKDKERVSQAIANALNPISGGNYNIKYTIVHPETGIETIVQAKGKTWFNEKGLPYRFNGTLQDITDQEKFTEKQDELVRLLSSSTTQLRLALEAGKLGSYNLDLETGKIDCTEQCKINFGRDLKTDLDYSTFLNMVLKEDRADIKGKFQEAVTHKTHYNASYRILTPAGEIRWIQVSALPVYDEQGKAIRMSGVTANITEEKTAALKVAEALKETQQSQEKLNLVISSSGLGTWEANLKTGELIFSDRFAEILGFDRTEDLSLPITRERVHPDDMPLREKAMKKAFETGELNFIGRMIFPDNSIRWIERKGKVFYDEGNEPEYMIGTLRDITEDKLSQQILIENEQKLRIFSDELEKKVIERTHQLNENNTELEKINKELQAFVYISSHDLQEPLRKIQTFASRITDLEFDRLSDTGRNYFTRMQDSAIRMQRLIDDLLAYSRTSTATKNFESVNLNRLVDEVKSDLQEELDHKRAVIKSGELPVLDLIPFQFRQLLQNLISNSLKFSKPHVSPVITIGSTFIKSPILRLDKADHSGMYCHLTVSDNGIGFEQQYADRVFELFQRLHGKDTYKGTGIGLAIVKKIVENHNGFISVHAQPDEGATFDIYIPVGLAD